ncbi:MAG: hypothetical protein KGY76_05270 [Candidatus Thermoplasmatota archaeon]|nr:hypothetical protein [Candidatus Thermoplasmatota archaeon]
MERKINRRLTSDENALEGMPLQMLIISLILAIGLPLVYSSLRHHDTQTVLRRAEEQAESINEKAKQLHAYGEGNSDVISIDLEDGIFSEIKFLELGNKSFRNLIRWEIREGKKGMLLLEDHLSLISDEPIKLGSGSHELNMECKFGEVQGTEGEMLYIKVSKL